LIAAGSSSSGLHHAVDQADAQRLGRVDHRAAHAQLERAGQADPPQQPLRPAEAGDDPELDLGLAEASPSRWRR
jgi:hypothetical protein